MKGEGTSTSQPPQSPFGLTPHINDRTTTAHLMGRGRPNPRILNWATNVGTRRSHAYFKRLHAYGLTLASLALASFWKDFAPAKTEIASLRAEGPAHTSPGRQPWARRPKTIGSAESAIHPSNHTSGPPRSAPHIPIEKSH